MRSYDGHEIIVRLTPNHDNQVSYFAVVALDDQYVKFRISQPLVPGAGEKAREFAKQWVALYVGDPPT